MTECALFNPLNSDTTVPYCMSPVHKRTHPCHASQDCIDAFLEYELTQSIRTVTSTEGASKYHPSKTEYGPSLLTARSDSAVKHESNRFQSQLQLAGVTSFLAQNGMSAAQRIMLWIVHLRSALDAQAGCMLQRSGPSLTQSTSGVMQVMMLAQRSCCSWHLCS